MSAAAQRLFDDWRGGSAPTKEKPFRLHYCPDMRRAAFVVTDHGDRTRLAVSRAIYMGHSDTSHPDYGRRGIVGAGVRITQGVFCSGWPGFDYLENSEFLALMRAVHEAGSEVCPHNTSEQMSLPPNEIHRNIDFYATNFGLKTWIDHFRLPSNLTQSGMDPKSPYFILDHFRAQGGRWAWSFIDRFAHPPDGELNLFAPPSMAAFAKASGRQLKNAFHLRRLTPAARASVGAVTLKAIGADAMGNLLVLKKNPLHAGIGRYASNLARFPANLMQHWREMLRGNPPAFPMRWDEEHSLYWFDTARVLFISQSYNARSIDRLVADAGLHIGHTYLGFHGPKYDDCAFEELPGKRYRVSEDFERFLGRLRRHVSGAMLWNPTLREFGAYLDGLSSVSIRPRGNGWEVANAGSRSLKGVTLRSLSPVEFGGCEIRSRHDADGYWFCTDLEPGAVLSVAGSMAG